MSSEEYEAVGFVISGGFICWLSGYGAGVIFRYVRNLFMAATR